MCADSVALCLPHDILVGGDRNGENNLPNPNPVTDADCNPGGISGYIYNIAAADRYGLLLPPRT